MTRNTSRTPAKKAAAKTEEKKQPGFAITDQAAFCRTLGINPDTVVNNSVRIEFAPNGVALVFYTASRPVTPTELAQAFIASSGMLGPTKQEEGTDGDD